MNRAFSEYVLYEPILRILMSRGYIVECEHPCPGIGQPKTGDKKRLDFYASLGSQNLVIDVKWLHTKRTPMTIDVEKQRAVKTE